MVSGDQSIDGVNGSGDDKNYDDELSPLRRAKHR